MVDTAWLVVAALASWRITNILYEEEITHPLRRKIGASQDEGTGTWSYPDTFIGRLWMCFWCLSIWVSVICSVLYIVEPRILLPFALSSVAIWMKEKL